MVKMTILISDSSRCYLFHIVVAQILKYLCAFFRTTRNFVFLSKFMCGKSPLVGNSKTCNLAEDVHVHVFTQLVTNLEK